MIIGNKIKNSITPTSNLPVRETRLFKGALVEYEQHGKNILGVISGEHKSQWLVYNSSGKEIELSSSRLYLYTPQKEFTKVTTGKEIAALLQSLIQEVEKELEVINLRELWEILENETNREFSSEELAELYFTTTSLAQLVAFRQKLICEGLYFKRHKTGFSPRSSESVEELEKQQRIMKEREGRRQKFLETLLLLLEENKPFDPLSESEDIKLLEELAIYGAKSPRAKDASLLLESIENAISLRLNNDRTNHDKLRRAVQLHGRSEEKAFQLLVAISWFSPNENLAIYRLGLPIKFSNEELKAAEAIRSSVRDAIASPADSRVALNGLDIYSIDAAETSDIDDSVSLEYLDNGYRLGIHITDVSAFIHRDSLLYNTSMERMTSVYFPENKIPMLPHTLSEDTLSLKQDEPRFTLSYLIDLNHEGVIKKREVKTTLTTVSKRLSYDDVDNLLYGDTIPPIELASDERLSKTFTTLWEIVSKLEERRIRLGANQFSKREVSPVVGEDGVVRLNVIEEETPARKIISELMILANETAALFAAQNNIPLVFRSQETPHEDTNNRLQTIPEGPARDFYSRTLLQPSLTGTTPSYHSGLGLAAYAQVTSPIRRLVDLINQQQITTFLKTNEALYTEDELIDIIARAESILSVARTAQRERIRFWLYTYLQQNNIRELKGLVVRVEGPKPLAEIELLGITFPFRSPRHKQGSSTLTLGSELMLHIQKVDAQGDDLILVEKNEAIH